MRLNLRYLSSVKSDLFRGGGGGGGVGGGKGADFIGLKRAQV